MHRSRIHVISVVALGLVLTTFLGSGCASFNHEWKKAAENQISENGLPGRWQGTWHSDANDHSGKLRCVVTKTDDAMYRARFHANYMKILSFGYTVALKTEPITNGFSFSGQADLGRLAGGVYHYEGHAETTN